MCNCKLFFVPSKNQIKNYNKENLNKLDFISIIKNYDNQKFLNEIKNKNFKAYAFCTDPSFENLINDSNIEDYLNLDIDNYSDIFKIIDIGDIQNEDDFVYTKILDNIKVNIEKTDEVFILITGGPTFQTAEFIVASELSKESYNVEVIGVNTKKTQDKSENKKIKISIDEGSYNYFGDFLNSDFSKLDNFIEKNKLDSNKKNEIIEKIKSTKTKHEVWFDRYTKETQIKNSILSFDYAHAKSLLKGEIKDKEKEQEIFNNLDEMEKIFAGLYEQSAIAQYIRATSVYEMGNYSEGIIAAHHCLKSIFISEFKYCPKPIDSKLFPDLAKNRSKVENIVDSIVNSYKNPLNSSTKKCIKSIIKNRNNLDELDNKINEIDKNKIETIKSKIKHCIKKANIEFIKENLSFKNDELNKYLLHNNCNMIRDDLIESSYDDLYALYNDIQKNRNKNQHNVIGVNNYKNVLENFIKHFDFIKSNTGNNTINNEIINDIFYFLDGNVNKKSSNNIILSIFGNFDPYSNLGIPTAPYFMYNEIKNVKEIWYIVTKEIRFAILEKQKIIKNALNDMYKCPIKYLSTEDFKLHDSIDDLCNIVSDSCNSYDYNYMFESFKNFFDKINSNNYKFYFNNSSGLPLLRTSLILSLLLDKDNLLEIYSLSNGNALFDEFKFKNKENTSVNVSTNKQLNIQLNYEYSKLKFDKFEFVNVYKLVRQMLEDKEYLRVNQICKFYYDGVNLKELNELLKNNSFFSKIFINIEALKYEGNDQYLNYYKKLRACLDLQGLVNCLVKKIYVNQTGRNLESNDKYTISQEELDNFKNNVRNNEWKKTKNNTYEYLTNPGQLYYLYKECDIDLDKLNDLYDALKTRNKLEHNKDDSLNIDKDKLLNCYELLEKLYDEKTNINIEEIKVNANKCITNIKNKYDYTK